MMKEFGVKFECKDANGDVYDFQEWYLNSNNISELSLELENFPISIYVKKESEHIFEPKKGYEGRWLRPIGAHYANHNGEQWVSAGIEPNPPEIIIGDNIHFFSPEVENE
jgi:hypothetical protein